MHEKSAGCNRTGEYKQCCTFAPKQDRKQIPDPLRSPRLSDRTNESSTQPSTGAVIFEPGEVEPSIQNLLQGRPFLWVGTGTQLGQRLPRASVFLQPLYSQRSHLLGVCHSRQA